MGSVPFPFASFATSRFIFLGLPRAPGSVKYGLLRRREEREGGSQPDAGVETFRCNVSVFAGGESLALCRGFSVFAQGGAVGGGDFFGYEIKGTMLGLAIDSADVFAEDSGAE